MKRFLPVLFCLFASATYSQTIDSIKYEYGYLYYRTYGKGEPVIMLSGGPGNNASQLEAVAKKISTQYKAILLEQRGTGRSIPSRLDSTTINFQSAINDINLLLSHLQLKSAILFGHSYGGSLALIYTFKFPQKVKSLLLLAPGYFALGPAAYNVTLDNLLGQFTPQQLARLTELENKQQAKTITDPEKIEMGKLNRLPYIYAKEKIDSLYPLMDGKNNRVTFQLLRNDFMKQDINLDVELKKIKCPVHLICGRQDFLNYIAYDLKIAKPDINLYWIEKSGHFPMHEQAEAFYKILFDILSKH
jgi:proline iminopeptidase